MFAVIFDMDGVIVDNFEYHLKAWQQFLNKYKIEITRQQLRDVMFGRGNYELFNLIFQRDVSDEECREFERDKESIYRDLYRNHIKPVRGFMEFLSLLKENNVKSAIATSAPRENVDFVMTEASILYPFDVIIDASNVSQAKPSPEIYLKTAQSLKTDPEKCIVFEDSRTGIESALNAGMKVVALTTSMTREELNHVHHVIDDFTEINLEILTNLM